MKAFRHLPWVVALSGLLAGACTAGGEAGPAPGRPVATIQEVMQIFVDPAADAIWDSVSSTVTARGLEEKRPATDADWAEQRRLALRLYEGAGLLLVPGRRVAGTGQALEDAHLAAVLPAAQIDRRIAMDPGAFRRRATDLQAAALQALEATRARNADLLLHAGAAIDQACERCHLEYWYPGGGPPPGAPAAPKAPGSG